MEEIIERIKSAGGCIYLVGGAVRDELMGRMVHDRDYCVVGIGFEKFVSLFPEAFVRGKDFPVFDMCGSEFALARIERKIGVGHKGFAVEANESVSIEQDLERRDITINSIAKNLITGELVDPFGGVKDIENKVIRATSSAFVEDPLRVYRVARFSAQLGFDVEDGTLNLMNKLKPELSSLSKERVFDEFRKALKTDRPSIFFEVLKKADILDIHFKEIFDLIGVEQPVKYHPEGDAYNHTMEVIDRACKETKNIEIRFSALVHDLGKGVTPKELYPHHHGHDIAGVKVVGDFCNRIGAPNSWKKCGKTSAKEHMIGGYFWQMTPPKQVDFLNRVNKSMLGLEGLQIVVNADKAKNADKHLFSALKQPILEDINGEYVKSKYGITEGIKVKELLRQERIRKMRVLKLEIET